MTMGAKRTFVFAVLLLVGCIERDQDTDFKRFASDNDYHTGEIVNEVNVVIDLCMNKEGTIIFCDRNKTFNLDSFGNWIDNAVPKPIIVMHLSNGWKNQKIKESLEKLSAKVQCSKGLDCYLKLS